MVNFPAWIPDFDSDSSSHLDLLISSDASFCFAKAFPPLGICDHVVVSVSIDFQSNSKRDAPFHCIAYDYFHADWDGFNNGRSHLWFLYLKMLGKSLRLKTTALLVLFLWLVKSLKHL